MTTSFSTRASSLAWALFAATAAACGSVMDSRQLPDGGTPAPPTDAAPPSDSAPVGARCDRGKPFAAPTPVAGVNTADDEIGFALTRDELTGFVTRVVQDPVPSGQLFASRRGQLTEPFGAPSQDATRPLNDIVGDELLAYPSGDGLTVYFSRGGGGADPQLMTATRASAGAAFRADDTVFVEGAGVPGSSPILSADGETLYWVDPTSGLHSASRQPDSGHFTTQLDLSSDEVARAVLSADELTLYYANSAVSDILVATRAIKTTVFDTGTPLTGLGTVAGDAPVFLTPDGCVLYLKSNRPGGLGGDDLWQAVRPR